MGKSSAQEIEAFYKARGIKKVVHLYESALLKLSLISEHFYSNWTIVNACKEIGEEASLEQ